MTAKQNIFVLAGKSILFDIFGDIVYFPVWWYTVGLKYRLSRFVSSISAMADQLALRLLLLNIFKPMFAQSDRAGRIISFFMRIVILIARSVYFFIFVLLQMIIVLGWIALPVFVVIRLFAIYLQPYASS